VKVRYPCRQRVYWSAECSPLEITAQNIATYLHQIPVTLQLSAEENTLLERLSVQGLDCHSPLEGCMKGTREATLQRINKWTTELMAPNILWLKGHPGIGKTAIATEIVEQLASVGRLGSSFFFQRQRDAVLTPQALWRTVAYDLARKHPTIRGTVVAKLKEGAVPLTNAKLENLFRHFIRDPLLLSGEIPNGRLPVIVIDALDECGGLEGQNSEHRESLLDTLRNWAHLPLKFKLIVTSRGENDLERVFSEINHTLIHISAGQTVDSQSSEDIRVFLTTKFQHITRRYPSLPANWPSDESVGKLVDMSGGLFIWAQTAVKFIQDGQPQRRLEEILKLGVSGAIDKLYETILTNSFHGAKAGALKEYSDFRSVVGAIILVKGPLRRSSLSALLSIDELSVEYVCIGLQSVLDYQTVLRFHHQSFVDFLLNRDKSPTDFLIETKHGSRKLTLACLRVMKGGLRFNMCNIESSYVRNIDIPELRASIDENIQPHLAYASCWWASHLAETLLDAEILSYIKYFMQELFLYWLELLSITRQMDQGSQVLQSLIDWISVSFDYYAIALNVRLRFR